MAVSWNPRLLMRLTETFTIDGVSAVQSLTFSEFDRASGLYNATSTQTVTKCAADKKALTAGAATLDLTALPGITAGLTVDFTGLQVVGAMFFVPTTAAGASLTIAKGASNGYELQSTHATIVTKGCWNFLEFGSRLGAVGGGAKNLDLTGTSTDELWYILIAGA